MDVRQKHVYEQTAYLELRRLITEQFTKDPVGFMQKHRKRPEDFTGHDLREYYRQNDFYSTTVSLGPELFKQQFKMGEFFFPIQQPYAMS